MVLRIGINLARCAFEPDAITGAATRDGGRKGAAVRWPESPAWVQVAVDRATPLLKAQPNMSIHALARQIYVGLPGNPSWEAVRKCEELAKLKRDAIAKQSRSKPAPGRKGTPEVGRSHLPNARATLRA